MRVISFPKPDVKSKKKKNRGVGIRRKYRPHTAECATAGADGQASQLAVTTRNGRPAAETVRIWLARACESRPTRLHLIDELTMSQT